MRVLCQQRNLPTYGYKPDLKMRLQAWNAKHGYRKSVGELDESKKLKKRVLSEETVEDSESDKSDSDAEASDGGKGSQDGDEDEQSDR